MNKLFVFLDRKNILFYSLAGLFLLILSTLLFFVGRGFDLSDEALYLMGFKYSQELKNSFSFFQPLIVHLLPFWEISIVGLRVLKILLLLVSTFMFCWSTIKWLSNEGFALDNKYMRYSCYLFVGIGSFLSYAGGPSSLSYNTLSYVFIAFIFSLATFNLCDYKFNVIYFLRSVFIGFFLFCLSLTKISNLPFVLLVVLIFWFLKYFKIRDIKQVLTHIFCELTGYLIGSIIFYIIYFYSFEEFTNWTLEYVKTLGSIEDHNLSDLLWSYLLQAYSLAVPLLKLLLILLSFDLLFLILRKRGAAFFQNPSLIIIWGFVVFFVLVSLKKIFIHYHMLFYISFLVVIIKMLLLNYVYFKEKLIKPQLFLFFAILLVIPFGGSFGTGNNIFCQISFYMTFWFIVFYFFLNYLFGQKYTMATNGIIILISVITSVYIFYYHLIYPYRVNGTLFSQNEVIIEQGNSSSIKVDVGTKNTVDQIKNVLSANSSFKASDLIFTYNYEIGLVYLVGGKTPSLAWYDQNNDKTNCFFLKQIDRSDARKTIFIIPDSTVFSDYFLECLKSCGINYPGDYIQAGTVDQKNWLGQRRLRIDIPREMAK